MKNIRIKNIQINSYRGLYPTSLDLENCNVDKPVIVGDNGIGKSTLLSAIGYLLTGAIPLGKSIEPVDLNGVINLSDEGDYKFVYSNKKIKIDGLHTYAKYDQFYDNGVKVSRDIINTILFPDNFVNSTPSVQRKLFMQIATSSFKLLQASNLSPEWIRSFQDKSYWEHKEMLSAELKSIRGKVDALNSFNNLVEVRNYLNTIQNNTVEQLSEYVEKNLFPKWESEMATINKKLQDLIELENKLIEVFNSLIQKKNYDFEVEVVINKQGEKEFAIKSGSIPFKNLNTVKKLEIATQLTLLFQRVLDINYPIIIDNFERVSVSNLETFKKLTKDHQVFVAKVV